MNQDDLSLRDLIPNIPGSYFDLLLEARELSDHEQWQEAMAILERVMGRLSRLPENRRRPGSVQAQFLVAAAGHLQNIHVELEDFQAAESLCRQLKEWDPQDQDYWQRRLYVLSIRQGQVEEGLQGLKILAADAPEDFDRWITLARQAVDAGRLDQAATAVAHAQTLMADAEDEDAEVAVLLVYYDLHRQKGEWAQARKAWEDAAYLNEDLEFSREIVMRQFLAADQWDEARRFIDEDSFGKPIADYYRAYLAHRLGNQARARELWSQVVEADREDYPGISIAQAMAYCYLGQPLQAVDLLLHDVQIGQEMSAHRGLTLALAWAMHGDREAALADLALVQQAFASRRQKPQWRTLEWYDFQTLVEDTALREELRIYFEPEKD